MTPDTQDQICRTIVFLQCFSNNYVVNLELETNWPDGFELRLTQIAICMMYKNIQKRRQKLVGTRSWSAELQNNGIANSA